MKPIIRHDRGAEGAGYSLIEVVVALGIVSFGIISMVSMLPGGLETFRCSINRSVSTQIAQRILNEARQTEFTKLTSLPTYRYFTDEGDETQVGDTRKVFIAWTVVATPVSVPATNGAFSNTSMARVHIRVANSPKGDKAATTKTSQGVENFTALIPKM